MLFYQMTHLFTLIEATVSQLCNLPVSLPSLFHLRSPPRSQIFLCTRTTTPSPWFKVSMLQ